ncbi:MAG TPA: ABC transporter ATP-binding protein [Mycobacteriales bacterium]|jgi:branched-chain amino acid transport system ATP-binding protein|nr:ABC transporter ATP-binding protein [Mycobacteriales bacterium]
MAPAALEVEHLSAGYGKVTVIHDLSMTVPEGAVVALLGPNGAGKTSTLGALTGTVRSTGGAIRLFGQRVDGLSAYHRAKRGLTLVPEGRGIFPGLTVGENLELAVESAQGVDAAWRRRQLARVHDMFPALGGRMKQRSGTLSGGEQQMLAMSRAFLANPKVLMMDEISAGLAPLIVQMLYDAVAELKADGTTIVLVEQYLSYALRLADICYVMAKGTVTFVGEPAELQGAGAGISYL